VEVTLDIVVRSTEIDVNGHVNNAKYLEYFEWGREEWYDQSGLSYDVLSSLGVQTVTVNININYRKECRQGDRLAIRSRPVKAGRTSFVLQQELYNQAGELCADAQVTSVTIDIASRTSHPIPEALRNALEG